MVDKKRQEVETQREIKNQKPVTAQLGSYTSPNRQQLSRICVQAQSRLLLDRPEGLGRGTGEAARKQTAFLEAKPKKNYFFFDKNYATFKNNFFLETITQPLKKNFFFN